MVESGQHALTIYTDDSLVIRRFAVPCDLRAADAVQRLGSVTCLATLRAWQQGLAHNVRRSIPCDEVAERVWTALTTIGDIRRTHRYEQRRPSRFFDVTDEAMTARVQRAWPVGAVLVSAAGGKLDAVGRYDDGIYFAWYAWDARTGVWDCAGGQALDSLRDALDTLPATALLAARGRRGQRGTPIYARADKVQQMLDHLEAARREVLDGRQVALGNDMSAQTALLAARLDGDPEGFRHPRVERERQRRIPTHAPADLAAHVDQLLPGDPEGLGDLLDGLVVPPE